MMERGGSSRLTNWLLASAAMATAGALWCWYERERRAARRLAQDAARARAEADAAEELVFESTPETRFEDRDLRHRGAAKYD